VWCGEAAVLPHMPFAFACSSLPARQFLSFESLKAQLKKTLAATVNVQGKGAYRGTILPYGQFNCI
jgi:hypothetical protein